MVNGKESFTCSVPSSSSALDCGEHSYASEKKFPIPRREKKQKKSKKRRLRWDHYTIECMHASDYIVVRKPDAGVEPEQDISRVQIRLNGFLSYPQP
jgi:hypothetical protein